MGPLEGIRVIEFAGAGPAPMCAMLLAEMGATVIRIERAVPVHNEVNPRPRRHDLLLRGRRAVAMDLKHPQAAACVLEMLEYSDALIEGFRPGVMERLGLGPQVCLKRNPCLVYGRMSAWGQSGPLAQQAARDINVIALSGVLHAIGRHGQAPALPLSLVGDFGGGALYLAMGVLAGILSAERTGAGQVVDAAMVDGAASLMTNFYGRWSAGTWKPQRGSNLTDSGAYFYDVHECADGKWLAVGALDAQTHDALMHAIGLDPAAVGQPTDRENWQRARTMVAARLRERNRDEWCTLLRGHDVCASPVLDFEEAPQHEHLKARQSFVEIDGIVQPAPAPRFMGTPTHVPMPPQDISRDNAVAALAPFFSPERVEQLFRNGILPGLL